MENFAQLATQLSAFCNVLCNRECLRRRNRVGIKAVNGKIGSSNPLAGDQHLEEEVLN